METVVPLIPVKVPSGAMSTDDGLQHALAGRRLVGGPDGRGGGAGRASRGGEEHAHGEAAARASTRRRASWRADWSS